MDKNLAIQYTIVGIIILCAIIWIAIRLFRKKKRKRACGCCSLADKCGEAARSGRHPEKKTE